MKNICLPVEFISVEVLFQPGKLDKLPEYLRDTVDWFMGKARRRDKDSAQQSTDEPKLYLEEAVLEQRVPETELRHIVQLPEGLDYNEWLASHTFSFFEHINLIYGTVSEFCTMSGCPEMNGPGNRLYLWFDEKGKKCKVAAPQYIDYVMTFTQNTIHDESVFPTKFANEFPASFECIVKKIHRLLFHVIAHIYQAHFKEIVLLNLHSHLNCIFAHLVLFNELYETVDDKELDVLLDLLHALKLNVPRVDTSLEGSVIAREHPDDSECDKSDSQNMSVDDSGAMSVDIADGITTAPRV